MHQQYHSSRTEKGIFVWGVNKLVEVVKELPIIDIPLKEIKEMDIQYWHEEGG